MMKGVTLLKRLTALVLKFGATLIALFIVLGLIYGMSFQSIVLLTAVIGVVSYIIGDLLILPRSNNIVATATDFGLAFLLIWSIVSFGNVDNNYRALFFASLLGAFAISICESLFHIYMYRNFYQDEPNSKRRISVMNYAMESSEEIAPPNKKRKK